MIQARIAQVVERIIGNDEVPSSTLGVSTTLILFEGCRRVCQEVVCQCVDDFVDRVLWEFNFLSRFRHLLGCLKI